MINIQGLVLTYFKKLSSILRVREELVEMLIGEGGIEYARDVGLIYECQLEEILGMLIFLGLLKLG